MEDIKKYLELQKSEGKIEALTEFINDNGQWYENYIYENRDFLGPYEDVLYHGLFDNFYFEELESDEIIEAVKDCIENKNFEIIEKHLTCELTQGIYRRSSEVHSINLGEQEFQFSGLYAEFEGLKTNCVYSFLCRGMTEDEVNKALNNADFCIYSAAQGVECRVLRKPARQRRS